MRTYLIPTLAVALSSLALVSISQAGTVHLKNGDVVTGKILKVSGGDILVDTEYSGKITIKAEHVVGLSSDAPLTVEYEDGREVEGFIDYGPDGKLIVLETAPAAEPAVDEVVDVAPVLLDLSEIEEVREVVPYFHYVADLQFGLNITTGNSKTQNIGLAASFIPTFGKNTIALDAQYNRGKADGTLAASNWQINGQYEREFFDDWFWLVFNSYQNDKLQDLNLRIIAGGGLGYNFFYPDPTLLRVSLGPAYVNENFSGSSDDRQFAALRWTLDFDRDLWSPDVSVYHNHRLTVGLSESQLIILSAQGFRFNLIADLALLLEFQFDHNNSPADGAKQNDYRYLVKLAYDFSGDQNDWWH